MPSFSTDPAEHAPDFALAGEVTLFWRLSVIDDAADGLRRLGYQTFRLRGSERTDPSDLHDAFASGLSFPDYYGRNLAALEDCMYDFVLFEFGSDRSALGTALVIDRFDVFTEAKPDFAEAVLHSLARSAILAAKYGHRLAVLVQTDDPHPSYGPVGGYRMRFNEREWLDSRRQVHQAVPPSMPRQEHRT
jgi:RNAse (barnase) inhibitor barstar